MTQTPIAAQLNPAAPRIDYLPGSEWRHLPEDVLFAVTFGDVPAPAGGTRVALAPLAGAELMEVWYANGVVRRGATGDIRFSTDQHFLAGVMELDESAHGGIVEATAYAYRCIARFLAASEHPYLLRTWNYFGAINDGAGDAERYRGFCTGRVAGLAGRKPGVALDNPRQVSPWRYPREYGETSPTFSRAVLVSPRLLLVSGTASIVGHVSQHPGDTRRQLREILANLQSMLEHAQAHSPVLPTTFGAGTRLKAYVRYTKDAGLVEKELRAALADAPLLVLQGDVCREELLVELDCLHATTQPSGR